MYQEKLDYIVYLQAWLDEHGVDVLTMRHFGDLPQPESIGARPVFTWLHNAIVEAAALRYLISKGA